MIQTIFFCLGRPYLSVHIQRLLFLLESIHHTSQAIGVSLSKVIYSYQPNHIDSQFLSFDLNFLIVCLNDILYICLHELLMCILCLLKFFVKECCLLNVF